MTISPGTTSTPQQFRGERLRELREQHGLDVAVLAKRLAISAAQLRQLEQNQSTLFYNETIRVAAARKVSQYLGEPLLLEPGLAPTAEDAGTSPVLDTGLTANPVQQASAASSAAALAAKGPVPAWSGHAEKTDGAAVFLPTLGTPLVRRPGLRGWTGVLLGAGAMGAVVLSVQLNQPYQQTALAAPLPVPQSQTKIAEPSLAKPAGVDAPVLTSQTEAAPPATSVLWAKDPEMTLASVSLEEPVHDAAGSCGDFTGPVASFSPSKAVKDGTLVYVVGAQNQVVCLKDGQGKVSRHVFTASTGQSFYGTAPWLVQSTQLAALQIFFQGVRVRVGEADSTRLRLIATEPF